MTRTRKILAAFSGAVLMSGLLVGGTAAPAAAVEQAGPDNYAGPNCPGSDWNCTDETNVVQISDGGQNVFECAEAAACLAEQSNTTGSNAASCNQATTANGTQACSITQSNDSGSNTASVSQTAIVVVGGLLDSPLQPIVQSSGQEATVDQTNQDGTNTIEIGQLVSQAATANLNTPVTHRQDARQAVQVGQVSETGDQSLDVSQSEALDSDVTSIGATQLQNATVDGVPNQDIVVVMHTDSGVNNAVFAQSQDFSQNATGLAGGLLGPFFTGATQQQGAVDEVDASLEWEVDSNNFSIVDASRMSKDWFQNATPNAANSQFQHDFLKLLGKGLTPHLVFGADETATLQTLGTSTCIQEIEVHAKIQADGSQNCVGQASQSFSGTHFEGSLHCVNGDCETTKSEEGNSETGDEGCGAGFYRQPHHHSQWPAGISTGMTLDPLFDVPDSYGLDDETVLDALQFNSSGQLTPTDAAMRLLRQAAAAALNAAHPDVAYAMDFITLRGLVNEALDSGDIPAMSVLQAQLDAANSQGCPL